MTLAFLEDTGHYKVDYALAGRLVEPTTPTPLKQRQSWFGTDSRKATAEERRTGTVERGPGYLRWGREAGCEFFTGSVSQWPTEYTCTSNGESGCSPDGRMSAQCYLRKYSASSPASVDSNGKDTCYRDRGNKICSNSGGGASASPFIVS